MSGARAGNGSFIAIIVPGIAKPVLALDVLSCNKDADLLRPPDLRRWHQSP